MMNQDLKKLLYRSLYVHKEIVANDADSAETRWLNKKIYDTVCLYDGTSLDNIELKDCLEASIDHQQYLTAGSSLKILLSTDVENVVPRPSPVIKIMLPIHNLTKYNRIACDIYIKAQGYHNFYYQFFIGNQGTDGHHSPSLLPNQWNHVIWEITDVDRDLCDAISINPWLTGTPPEAKPEYEIFIDNIMAEAVDAEVQEGWKLDYRIAYSHVGYLTNAKKIALIGNTEASYFSVYHQQKKVLFKPVVKILSSLGKFYLLDFSEITDEGLYYLEIGNNKTAEFLIGDNVFDSSIWKSMNFLRLLRCGEDIAGVHSACHLNCRSIHPNGSSVPNFGGWHDAGDVSQFEIPTAEITHALLDLAYKEKNINQPLYFRLLEEARIGLNWLLRTRFGDGYRALAVTYSIWRKNILTPDNQSIWQNVAENGPFENFLASAALAKAYSLFNEEDEIFALWCLNAAKEDFDFAVKGYEQGIYTKRWGPNIDSQVAGHGCVAACELYLVTQQHKYLDIAIKYAKIIMACQETTDLGMKIDLRGFFYEDPKHQYLLTYEHRGHEQSPIQGLVMLAKIASNHPDYPLWINSLQLYRSYIINSMQFTYPYGLMPGHLYIVDKINPLRFTIPSRYGTKEIGLELLKKQAMNGEKMADGIYLRRFPIAIQRRGFHATLLSKAKAVSSIATLFNDYKLKQIAIDQLEWILGKNPFASSTMYGEGKNYHPLYVAFSRQIVGALPVGIMTNKDNDAPFWPMRNHAVYKEIWGHTTGKYLWILADLIEEKRN